MKPVFKSLAPYMVMGLIILAAILTQGCTVVNIAFTSLQQAEARGMPKGYYSRIKQRSFLYTQGRSKSLIDKRK